MSELGGVPLAVAASQVSGLPSVFVRKAAKTYGTCRSDRSRSLVSTHHRKRALILLGAATVAFTVILELIDPSHVSHGPTILNFEFAASHARAAQIVAEWGPKGRSAAHLSLLLDYGYMLSYGLFFALAGFAVRDTSRARGWPRLTAIGVSSSARSSPVVPT